MLNITFKCCCVEVIISRNGWVFLLRLSLILLHPWLIDSRHFDQLNHYILAKVTLSCQYQCQSFRFSLFPQLVRHCSWGPLLQVVACFWSIADDGRRLDCGHCFWDLTGWAVTVWRMNSWCVLLRLNSSSSLVVDLSCSPVSQDLPPAAPTTFRDHLLSD